MPEARSSAKARSQVFSRLRYILANLRHAVKDAGLPAHEQRLDAILPESRKDCQDRGRDQGCLLMRDIWRRASGFLATARAASARSIHAIRLEALQTSKRN